MPSIRIDAGTLLRGHARQVMAAVEEATHQPLNVRPAQNDVLLTCHEAGARLVPQGCSDQFCLVEIKMLAGRSDAQKKALQGSVQRALAGFGVAAGEIKIIAIDVPTANVGPLNAGPGIHCE